MPNNTEASRQSARLRTRICGGRTSSSTHLRGCGLEHSANNLRGQLLRLSFEGSLSGNLILFNLTACLLNLGLRSLAGLRDCSSTCVRGLLAASFLRFEQRQARLPQLLLVFRG